MDLGLKDKVAVITGGSTGIGLAVGRGLAAEGVHVVLAARDGDRARSEAASISKKFAVNAFGCAADVTEPTDIDALAAKCKFRNCKHDSEPACAVRAAVKRGELEEDRLASFARSRHARK